VLPHPYVWEHVALLIYRRKEWPPRRLVGGGVDERGPSQSNERS
jgi:hypothetical protein